MSSILQSPPKPDVVVSQNSSPRRSPWRRRLIDVERGFIRGFRREASLFGYTFGLVMTITAAVVLGISMLEWSIVILGSTGVFVAELFNLSLRCLYDPESESERVTDAIRISRAAVFLTAVSVVLAIGLIFANRVYEIWNP